VQIVENGTHIVRNENSISIQQPSGNTSMHRLSLNLRSHEKRGGGWLGSISAYGTNFTYLSGKWTVPYPPITNIGQQIFFFNSLENGVTPTDLIQPVLQFQDGVSGWTLASWYVSAGNGAWGTTFYPVNIGDTIEGVLELNGGIWSILGYVNGVLQTSLTLDSTVLLVDPISVMARAQAIVFEALFSTTPTCQEYPLPGSITVSDVVLYDDDVDVLTPVWFLDTGSNSCNVFWRLESLSELSLTWSI